MRAARIEVSIAELVVDGAQMDAPERLGPALQEELARLIQGGHKEAELSQSQISAASADGASSDFTPSIEAQIARAIYQRIGDRIGGAPEGAPGVKANKESR
jgi:3-oxoacyl-(acyl-carrier-protein) synthase